MVERMPVLAQSKIVRLLSRGVLPRMTFQQRPQAPPAVGLKCSKEYDQPNRSGANDGESYKDCARLRQRHLIEDRIH
jgi:hypothetical protein